MPRPARLLSACVVVLLLLGGCANTKPADTSDDRAPDKTLSGEQVALKVLKEGLIGGDLDVIKQYVAEDYKQHNPNAADGRQGLLDFIESRPAGAKPKFRNLRTITDGEFIAMHNEYDWGEKQVVIDLFRVKDNMLVEHWDAIQLPPLESVNRNTMLDGETKVTDKDKTSANKKLVRAFVDDVLIGGKLDMLADYLDGENFKQHNPTIADGATAWGNAMSHARNFGKQYEYDVRRVIGEGNFVLVQSKAVKSGEELAMYNLFRVENGKIVEHWDVMQTIPETAANDNGMVD